MLNKSINKQCLISMQISTQIRSMIIPINLFLTNNLFIYLSKNIFKNGIYIKITYCQNFIDDTG